MFIGKYNKSVILTYLGLASSVVGMYFVMNNLITQAMICLVISGICDMFDGTIARMCKRNQEEKNFGVQIDSLVDTISFLAFPSVIGIALFKDLPIYTNIILILYAIAGVIRLAWFNMHANSESAVEYYIGVPVTYSAFFFPLIYAIGLIVKKSLIIVYPIAYALVGLAFIINVKIPKLKGIWNLIIALISVAIISIIIFA